MAITAAQLDVRFTSTGAGKVKSELKGLDDAIESAGSGFKGLYDQVNSFASKAVDAVGKVADGLGKIALTGLTAIFTKSAKAAFDQVNAVEQATFALGAYGDSAEDVNAVLQDLTDYAQDASRSGGIFWSEDLFKAAQNLVVMGDELENVSEHVQIMSRAVGLGTVRWDELNMIVGRVIATGKLAGNEFDELSKAGFRLDPALRGATVSAEELFAALDRGIPADSLLGQADTIRGKLLYLQGAFINVGQALLGVNDDLQFTADGLGSRIVGGIDAAREALLSLEPAAATAGQALVTIIDAVTGLVQGFQMLPEPVQNIAIGVAAAITAFGMFRQAIAAVTGAMRLMGLGAFTALFSPLGLAITGVALAGGLLIKSFMDQKQAAANFETSLKSLRQTLVDLRLDNLDAAADRLENFLELTQDINTTLEENRKNRIELEWEWGDGKTREDLQAFVDTLSFGTEEMNRFTEAQNRIGNAFADPRIDGDRLLDDVMTLFTRLQYESGYTADQFLADFEAISNGLDKYGANIEGAADKTETAFDRMNASRRSALDILSELDQAERESLAWQTEAARTAHANREISLETRQAMAEAAAQAEQEWIQAALAIGGFDNALSQLNLTGLTGEMGMFAEEGIRAGQAFDNTFRVLVTNVQQIGQGVQQATDWMADLVVANEEGIAVIDTLAAEERISYAERDAAAQAYNDTLAANYDIQQNLLAIQAMQAPYVAQQVTATQAYVAELANMDAAQQRVALSFMDMQTVQQAQEIITLGNSEAFKQMEGNGRAAFEAVIQGALQTNPMLFDVLKTMGIISGTPLDFDVDYSALEGAGSAIEQLTTQVGYLVDTLREIYGLPPIAPEVDTSSVEAATGPGGALGVLQDMIRNLTGEPVDIPVNVQLGDGTGGAAYMGPSEVAALLGLPESVDVPVNIIPGSAAAGDGTGGAGNWRDMLGIPPTVDVPATITPDTSAVDTALAGYESQTISVDVVIGTNELDTGLTGWGLGTGGGGGGAAGYEGKTVSVDIVLGDNALDTAFDGTYGPVMVDVEANMTAFAASLATIGLGGAGLPAVEVPVTANLNAFWEAIANSLDGTMRNRPDTVVTVTADIGTAVADLNSVTSAADSIPESESVTVVALAEGATAALQGVTDAANDIPESENVDVSVSGAAAAIGALNGVAAAANSIPSSVSTTITTNRVTNNVQTYSVVGSPVRAFASGGYVDTRDAVLVGERGPELVQLPYGSYVHTASETAALMSHRDEGIAPPRSSGSRDGGGDTYYVNVRIDGNVIGNDDFADAVAEHTVWKIASTKQRRDLAKGVAA